jgi:hypothetical protein
MYINQTNYWFDNLVKFLDWLGTHKNKPIEKQSNGTKKTPKIETS